MTIPLVILGLFSIFHGYYAKDQFIGLGSVLWGNSIYISPDNVSTIEGEFGIDISRKLLPLLGSVTSIIIGVYIYKQGSIKGDKGIKKVIYRFLNKRYHIDNIYNSYIISNVYKLANITSQKIDKGILELIGVTGIVRMVKGNSIRIAKLDSGYIPNLALNIIIGLIIILGYGLGYIIEEGIILILVLMMIPSNKFTNKKIEQSSNNCSVSYNPSRKYHSIGSLDCKFRPSFHPTRSHIADYSNKSEPKPSLISSLYIGMKKGVAMELLPLKVSLFLEKPIVRVLRVIGGLSVLLSLFIRNKIILIDLPIFVFYTINIIAIIQLIQIIIISIIKFIYGINKLIRHKKEFEIRNSPINKLASISVKAIYCWKVGCNIGSSTVGVLGGTVLIDGVLESSGYEKIFQPYIKSIIDTILGNRYKLNELSQLVLVSNKNFLESEKIKKELEYLNILINNFNELCQSENISEKDKNEIKKEIEKVIQDHKNKIQLNEGKIVKAYKNTFKKSGE